MSKELQKTIMEALGSALPEEGREKLVEAVETLTTEMREGLEQEFQSKLEESYKQFDDKIGQLKEQYEQELDSAEKIAETGYAEAAQLIKEARDAKTQVEQTAYKGYEEAKAMLTEQERVAYDGYEEAKTTIEKVRAECEAEAYKGYQEAYGMINELRQQNQQLEQDLYEQYQKALLENREDLIDKIDQFLTDRIDLVREAAVAEYQEDETQACNLIKKIYDLLADFMAAKEGDETETTPDASPADTEEFEKVIGVAEEKIAGLQEEVKRLEAKNFRLLAEHARHKPEKVLTESAQHEDNEARRKEREQRREQARLAEGNGEVVNRTEVVVENVAPAGGKGNTRVQGNLKLSEAKKLAGIK